MKNIKKLLSVLFLLVVSFTQVLRVNAAGTGTITVNKAIVGETYSIYRILDLETYDKANNHYIYRANDDWKAFVDDANLGGKYLEAKNENGATYYVWKENANVVDFTKEAKKYAEEKNRTATASQVATTTTVKFKNLDLGYYLVKSSVGALLHLDTTDPNGVVNEKNTVEPDIKKEVKEDSTGSYGTVNDAQIGDTVEFQTTVTVGAGYTSYVVYDIMSNGLTLNANSIEAYIEADKVDTSNYTISTTTTGYTFVLSFKDEFIAKQPIGTNIVIKYSAVLNKDAVIEGAGNDNKTKLTWNDGTTDEKKTTTYAYVFELVKTDKDKKELSGAEFKLYDKAGKEVKVVLKDEATNTYRVAVEGETGVTIKVGKAIIEGLDADTYYLEEVVAPVGFNKLTSRVEVIVTKISANNTFERTSIGVENYTGKELPETGSTGTALFVTFGLILVLGFGLLLVTKLRAYKENI